MLKRIAASLLSLSLLTTAASARTFSQPPPAAEEIEPGPAPAKVAPVLRVDRAAVRAALAARRAKNLASFRAYRKAGVYPHNLVDFGPMNIWLDGEGHLCAAATMIDKDGKHELVMEIAKTDNQIRLTNVKDGALHDWILTSGFTKEEIDRVQAPMVYEGPEQRERMQQQMRIAEDNRLRALYAETDAYLVKHQQRGLDAAVDRLMTNPALARALVEGNV